MTWFIGASGLNQKATLLKMSFASYKIKVEKFLPYSSLSWIPKQASRHMLSYDLTNTLKRTVLLNMYVLGWEILHVKNSFRAFSNYESHTQLIRIFIRLATCYRVDIWDYSMKDQLTSNFPLREYGRKSWEGEVWYSMSSKFEGVRNWDIGSRFVSPPLFFKSWINISMTWKEKAWVQLSRFSPA